MNMTISVGYSPWTLRKNLQRTEGLRRTFHLWVTSRCVYGSWQGDSGWNTATPHGDFDASKIWDFTSKLEATFWPILGVWSNRILLACSCWMLLDMLIFFSCSLWVGIPSIFQLTLEAKRTVQNLKPEASANQHVYLDVHPCQSSANNVRYLDPIHIPIYFIYDWVTIWQWSSYDAWEAPSRKSGPVRENFRRSKLWAQVWRREKPQRTGGCHGLRRKFGAFQNHRGVPPNQVTGDQTYSIETMVTWGSNILRNPPMLFLWWHLNLARLHDWMLGCWEMLLVSRFGAIPNVDSLFYIFPWSSPFFRPLKPPFSCYFCWSMIPGLIGNDLWIFSTGISTVVPWFFPLKNPKIRRFQPFNPAGRATMGKKKTEAEAPKVEAGRRSRRDVGICTHPYTSNMLWMEEIQITSWKRWFLPVFI